MFKRLTFLIYWILVCFSTIKIVIVRLNYPLHNTCEGDIRKSMAHRHGESVLIRRVSSINEVGRERECVSFTGWVVIRLPCYNIGRKVGGVTGEDKGIFR